MHMNSTMSPQHTPINPSSLRTRFAYRFLRSLKDLKKNNRSITSRDINRRSNRVKIAAYASMASVVGSRRAWSRAILWKVKNSSRNRGLTKEKRMVKRIHAIRRRGSGIVGGGGERNPNPKKDEQFGSGLEGKLRKLVPGGETMDMCGLLEETADYIKCLATQVDVMRKIVDLYST